MEKSASGERLRGGHDQFHACLAQRIFPFDRKEGLSGQVFESVAAIIPGTSAGAAAGGL